MTEEPPQRVLRMKLACQDHIQFLLEFAPKMKARVFVPMEDAPPPGSRVTLHIRFSDGEVHVRGTAQVLKVVTTPRPGIHARYVSLEANSVQFPLAAPTPVAAEATEPGHSTTGETFVPPFTVSGEHRVHVPPAGAASPPPADDVTQRVAIPPRASPSTARAPLSASPAAVPAPAAPPPRSSLLPPAPSPQRAAPAAQPAPLPEPPPPARVASVLEEPPQPPPPEPTRVVPAPAPLGADETTGVVPPFAEPPTKEVHPAHDAPEAEDVHSPVPPSSRPRWPLAAGAVLVLALLTGGAWVVAKGSPTPAGPTDPALLALLEKADARMASQLYAAPGGDAALDHVRVAVKAAPKDPAVKKRQAQLAAVFEEKAKAAEEAGDYAEAAVHLQALALTEPGRPGVEERLAHAEDVVKNQTRAQK